MRREGPIILGLIVGLVVVVSNFLNVPSIVPVRNQLDTWNNVAITFASAVGLVNLSQLHLRRISQKREGTFFSLTLLISMYAYLAYAMSLPNSGDRMFQWIWATTVNPMSSTMFSLLAFYIASAAYRAFRVRNAEASVLLVAAVIVMLGGVPLGRMISSAIPQTATWILTWPNTAGMRGIQLGATLGGISTALRVLIGIERGHLGGE